MQEGLEKERRRRGGSILRWVMHSERRFYMTIAVCAVMLFLVQVWLFYRPVEVDVNSVRTFIIGATWRHTTSFTGVPSREKF